MKFSRFIIIVVAVVAVNILLIFNVSGTENHPSASPVNLNTEFREGDLVFRSGNGVISDWFRRCSLTDPSYSHAGILLKYNGVDYVVHMEQTAADGSLRMERLSDFWGPRISHAGAVYRLDLPEEQRQRLQREIRADLQKGVVFDEQFVLDDDAKMYCSEWIRNKVIHATSESDYFPVSMAGDFRYVAPDNLYINPHAMLVYKFNQQ